MEGREEFSPSPFDPSDPPTDPATLSTQPGSLFTRRRFLSRGALYSLGGLGLAAGYPFVEACLPTVRHLTFSLPRLPEIFRGTTVAFLSDIHHGPLTGTGFIRKVVERTQALEPDLILLGGDYVHTSEIYIAPCFDLLRNLSAPLGVHGVLGNHDYWENEDLTRECLAEAGITDLTNTGVWIQKEGHRLRLAGVGDLWEDSQDLEAALGDCGKQEAAILLSHNPDYAEAVEDARVGLILSGHTHGGQIVIPAYGAPIMPSAYGQKYRYGWVKGPTSTVFVTSGLGTIYPPVRFRCRPEIVLLTLV
jgi:predicted MPP superfamily phosphohydrolase